jgi:hypothetical protein
MLADVPRSLNLSATEAEIAREAGCFMALRQDIGRRYGGRLWLHCQSKRLSVLLE